MSVLKVRQVVFGSAVKDPAGKRVISSYTAIPKSGIEMNYILNSQILSIKEKGNESLYPVTNIKQLFLMEEMPEPKKRGRPAVK